MKNNPLKISEYAEQVLFVEYLDILKNQNKIILFTAIPNNTWTPSWGQKIKNKRSGLNPGFPDLFIITNKRAICIEMKVLPNKTTPQQRSWGEALEHVGIHCYVAYGYESAKQYIDLELKSIS